MEDEEKKNYLIMYDIADPKRLKKVEKYMEGYAYRVQLSIYESRMDEETYRKMKHGLERLVDDMDDNVLFFPLCDTDWEKRERFGKGDSEEEAFNSKYIVL